ncbi:fumarylacetoacetate hydrolase family protein [Peribacillus muralis]|uniref:fumarylacetoacetate hydrolase family protein n=1 Tax=Peribacillus muralis TaxID=264697 RepID=UPI001F4DAB44|nr:fumarylacetoacetate hydrolase family protein [Peribacillus muralis]MCK1992931.1 fumarylacetoacetate hydrolase family protein [Peribacillus muralis]MCK2013486.1 fumarylacetoacetate hydrolase family protein [Peribacillus muralis]
MKLVSFHTDKGIQTGVHTEKGVYPLNLPMEEIIKFGYDALDSIIKKLETNDKSVAFLPEDSINYASCIQSPAKIICVGLNYRKHAIESGMEIPTTPVLFTKYPNTLSGNADVIYLPSESTQVDYEAELGIVIGKRAKNVSENDALDYVFGYCNVNDVSARDLQFRTSQWLLGKSIDGFNPMGPYLVTAEEVGDPNNLSIQCSVNGEVRQNSNTSDMIFSCKEIISYLSRYMTLEPGDVILTGTPEGVVFGIPAEKQVWLKDGDVVSVEIEKLGVLTNSFVSES